MRGAAAFLAGLVTSPAWAEPPPPCISAPSYNAVIAGLERDGWIALPSDEPLAEAVALPLGLAMTLIDRGDLPAMHREIEASAYGERLRGRMAMLADYPDERMTVLSRGEDSVFVRESGEQEGQALFYRFAVLSDPDAPAPPLGAVIETDRHDTSDGWITTARLNAELLTERIRAPVTITSAYGIVRHLFPVTPSQTPDIAP